jgi:hypothetical protein
MQVLDDTGKVLMNIVGGERIFQLSTLESVAFKKSRQRLMRENMNQIIHKQNKKNTFKSRLNGQPQLTIIQVAKLNPITKESLTMTSIALWTAFLKSLDQQLLLTELMLQTIL